LRRRCVGAASQREESDDDSRGNCNLHAACIGNCSAKSSRRGACLSALKRRSQKQIAQSRQTLGSITKPAKALTNAKSSILAAGFNDNSCGGAKGIARWNFPAGGTPTHDNDGGVVNPVGAAISVK
jgi:hypothetical protein